MKSFVFTAALLLFSASSAFAQGLYDIETRAFHGIVIERIEPQAGASAQESERDESPIFDALNDTHVKGARLKHLGALRDFYKTQDFRPHWTRGDRLNGDGRDMLEILKGSWTHGLNPFSYHIEKIETLRASEDEADFAKIDVLLSDAYVSFGRDMTGIRVNPAAFKSHKRFWKKPMAAVDLLALIREDDADDVVEDFSPRGATYKRLREELIELVEEAPEPYALNSSIQINGLLKPYQEHKAVPDFRARFGISAPSQNTQYDDQLISAVMRFQRDRNLKADGIIGPATLRAINQTRKDKIHQIIANLERLRWVDENKPEKFVVVNIPSAMLWAIDDGRVEFDMPVIVGRKKRATNIFVTDITGVRFNPTWTVPPTIKKEDIVPELIKNPMHLVNKGMEFIYGSGSDAMTLDPASIDWASITEEELATLRMVQTSGAHNPLGTIRVLMPNGYNIYLHDTNERQYFDRPGRAESSGCIRLKNPERMAQFILENKRGWSDEMYHEAFNDPKMKDVFINETIPVYLVYYTVWVGHSGELVYSHDLYDYDDELIKMLSNIDGFFIPVDNNGISGNDGYSRSKVVYAN